MLAPDPGPYVGPRPFEKDDALRFFGRHAEANELVSLIVAHPVVLLYAQSGAGKTSLLNAEVLPALAARGFEVIAGARVRGDGSAASIEGVKNVYAYNALVRLDGSKTPIEKLKGLSIKDYFAARPRLPGREGISPLRVLLFDQFEEIFTSPVHRWQDRGDFFDLVGDAIDADPLLRVIFSMREEFIASIDPYARKLPDGIDTRFRLEPLREAAALLAVTAPLAGTGRSFKPGAAERLVDNLLKVPIKSIGGVTDISGEFVEPLHLQLVCSQLWESLAKDVTVIDERYIQDYGDVDDALAAYYERTVRQVAEESRVKEGTIRNWIERVLITSDGARGIVPQGDQSTAGLPNLVVGGLEKRYLIRTEMRGNKAWYELTHDRFVGPIRNSNKRWRSAVGAGDATKREQLEAIAETWARGHRSQRQLLSGSELSRASDWLASSEAEELGASDLLKEFIQASQLAQVKKKRYRELAISGAIVAFALAIAAILGLGLTREADARRRAEDATSIVRGQVATLLAPQPGKEIDALIFGIKAVGQRLVEADVSNQDSRWLQATLRAIAPKLLVSQTTQPPEAEKGLRDALAAVGDGTWLRGNNAQVNEIWFVDNDQRVLAVSKEDACVWDSMTGRLAFPCIKPRTDGGWLQSSPRRKWVYSQPVTQDSGDRKSVRIWDVATGKRAFQENLRGVRSIQFSDDDGSVLALIDGSKAKMLDMQSGVLSSPMDDLVSENVTSRAISARGMLVASVNGEGVGLLWDARNGRKWPLPKTASLGRPAVSRALFAPDASRVAVVLFYPDKQRTLVSAWEIGSDQTPRPLRTTQLPTPTFAPVAVQFTQDAKGLIVVGLGSAQILDLATGALVDIADLPSGVDYELWDGGTIYAKRSEGTSTRITLVDAFHKKKLLENYRVPSQVLAADLSHDLVWLALLSQGNVTKVLNLRPAPTRDDVRAKTNPLAAACEKIRYQPEFEREHLDAVCAHVARENASP